MSAGTPPLSQLIAIIAFDSHFKSLGVSLSFANINPLSVNPTKWSNTLKQFVGKFPTDFLSVFDHFVKLVLKGLRKR